MLSYFLDFTARLISELSNPDEKQTIAPTVTEQNVTDGVEQEIAIDSFLPLLEALESPSLELIDGTYHLRGAVLKDEFRKLSAYAQDITEITLNDTCSSMDPGIWVRLLQLGAKYNKSATIFPCLKTLHIDIEKDDTPLSILPLFLVPTLESLVVAHFPKARLNILLTFLTTLTDEAPGLSSLLLDKHILYNDVIHSICMKFVKLHEFSLGNVGPTLNLATIQDIGQLPELEKLALNAQCAIYVPELYANVYITTNPASSSTAPIDNVSCSVQCEADQAPKEPSSPKLGFSTLTTLSVKGRASLMTALISSISSLMIQDISLELTPTNAGSKKISTGPTNGLTNPDKFQNLLRKVLESWAHSLTSIEILSSYPRAQALDLSIFQSLLLQPSLRHLEIQNWTVEADFGEAMHPLTTLMMPSKLETLYLPVDLGMKGITFNGLRNILESCPSLISFQCGFKNLSDIPPRPEVGVTFSLKALCVGNPTAPTDRRRLREIAQYLDALFPNLETIETQEGCNADQWKEIFELVQMCQSSRSHHLAQRA